jgi:exodeoxyribonuclease VII large subunit
MPETPEELMEVKGIKDAKCRKYGREILGIVARFGQVSAPVPIYPSSEPDENGTEELVSEMPEKPVSVSRFLDGVNLELSGMAARIRGEVSSVDERDRVVYFSLKDPEDGSMLNCLVFRFQYDVSGVRLREGDEIVVEGAPEVWKPMGRLSFKVGSIEYAGEGALKKAYDELYRKLESEGIFSPERKRSLPRFPERIALVTSERGAAIGDFLTNIGRLGIRIDLYPVSVEGKRAVFDILKALRYFRENADRYDLLVVIRGGGSIESLQAFNTESLVREIAAFPIPVIAGIGHEKDVSLSALAADRMVSTPTAAARTVREPFDRARQDITQHARIIISVYGEALNTESDRIEKSTAVFLGFLEGVSVRFGRAKGALVSKVGLLEYRIRESRFLVVSASRRLTEGWRAARKSVNERLSFAEASLRQYDPNRVLALGYAIVRAGGKVISGIRDISTGERIDISLSDGNISAEVKEKIRWDGGRI